MIDRGDSVAWPSRPLCVPHSVAGTLANAVFMASFCTCRAPFERLANAGQASDRPAWTARRASQSAAEALTWAKRSSMGLQSYWSAANGRVGHD